MKRPVLACLLALVAGSVRASHISLTTDAASEFRSGTAQVHVRLANGGDEPAMRVSVEARLGAARAESGSIPALAPGETFATNLVLAAPSPPGIHTAILTVRYADGNGYPFSALSHVPVFTADIERPPPSPVATFSPLVLHGTGRLALRLRNPRAEPIALKVTCLLPDEIRADRPSQMLSLAPGGGEEVAFDVRNASGLPGSGYRAMALIEETQGNRLLSSVASGTIEIRQRWNLYYPVRRIGCGASLLLGLLFVALNLRRRRTAPAAPAPGAAAVAAEAAVLALLFLFTLLQLAPDCLVADTTTVGGDTVAHNYLASHLRDSLFRHGRIVSWAEGWWCGFPMFQYYFCLPYVAMALLDLALPFNLAFKWVSVCGILLLPAAAWTAGRILRLPRPMPLFLAAATAPLLFDTTHTMWGVNIYSTLAGMIANSVSFPLMLLFLAAAVRDADDGRLRLRSVLLGAALVASHFFSSIIAALVLLIVPLLRPAAGFRRAFGVLAREAALIGLLMAWWLVPLVAKSEFSIDFGGNWNVVPQEHLPRAAVCVLAGALILAGFRLADGMARRFVLLTGWMLAVALFLFRFGYERVSPVFVNVRLWPFITYALLALAAAGAALLLRRWAYGQLAALAALVLMLLPALGPACHVREWARWNFEGLERKRRWPVFRDLVQPLAGTPGRLANDLHDDNNALGSSRIFECVPHLIGKPILEGGIVNSAAGSLYGYYVQGEMSRASAGFPTLVEPASFNPTNGTRHLELLGVRHFIARWPRTRAALDALPGWRKLRERDGWGVYELERSSGSQVFIPRAHPIAVRGADWKQASLNWLYEIRALDQPFVFLRPGQEADAEAQFGPVLDRPDFERYLGDLAAGRPGRPSPRPVFAGDARIWDEATGPGSLRFRTSGIGLPHIARITYFPNWRVRGASAVYMASPSFLLFYPEQEEIELYYGSTAADNWGRALTVAGLLVLAFAACPRARRPAQPAQKETPA